MTKSDENYLSHGELCMITQFGTEVDYDGDTYTGYFLNGLKHGYGTLIYSNGDIQEGLWEQGYITGQCSYSWSSGNKYVGEFKNDKLNGPGTFTGQEFTYEGDWYDDKRHGEGTFTHSNGIEYSGQWNNDQMHGEGEYISSILKVRFEIITDLPKSIRYGFGFIL